jgi:hypothetical protein
VSIKSQSNGQHVAAPARPLTATRTPARLPADDVDRYRLHVVATNVADAVMSIGGLIFDHAMAGWDVTVAVDGDSRGVVDDRPIRVLGATVGAGPCDPQVLAIATDVFIGNERLRRLALAAGKARATDVLLWGRRHPPKLNRSFVPVRHRPSAAAQVFKSHALCRVPAEPADEALFSMS